jgi:hypothetical protein
MAVADLLTTLAELTGIPVSRIGDDVAPLLNELEAIGALERS